MTIEQLELLDWRRRIFDAYRQVRLAADPEQGWQLWRAIRDELFATHPQSPVPVAARAAFRGLSYFDYDPKARVLAEVDQVVPLHRELATSRGGLYDFTRFAVASFELHGHQTTLELYWLEGYSGGVFLPFSDATRGKETYGAGRYVLDTAKGADLGAAQDRVVLDFNFAFNPSCAYDPRWACPLAPAPNQLPMPIRAGERLLELPQEVPEPVVDASTSSDARGLGSRSLRELPET